MQCNQKLNVICEEYRQNRVRPSRCQNNDLFPVLKLLSQPQSDPAWPLALFCLFWQKLPCFPINEFVMYYVTISYISFIYYLYCYFIIHNATGDVLTLTQLQFMTRFVIQIGNYQFSSLQNLKDSKRNYLNIFFFYYESFHMKA